MALLQIILVFFLIPAAMVAISAATGPPGARLVAYVLFPIALLLFALARHLRDRKEEDDPT